MNTKWLITTLLLCLFARPVMAGVIDAPHNQANGIFCSSCHSYSTWWQYPPRPATAPDYRARTTVLCLSCHNGNDAEMIQPHNSSVAGDTHGTWLTDCVDCHDPHLQDQLFWRGTNQNGLFLVSGRLTVVDNSGTPAYSYVQNSDNTTTIMIDQTATISKPGWSDPALWGHKNDHSGFERGLIFVHGLDAAYNTYQVIRADSTSITIKGVFDPAGVDPAVDADFGLIYGQLIKHSITAPTVTEPLVKTAKNVKFFDPNLKYTQGGLTDPGIPSQGICQICHTKTSLWTEDGKNDGHNADQVCTSCHLHSAGFSSPLSHEDGDGTFAWNDSCQSCHNPNGDSSIIQGVHKVGSGNTCTLCHQNETGGSLAAGTSAANAVPGLTPHLCRECHTDAYSLHHALPESQNGDCGYCHPDPRPQWQTSFNLTGSMPRQLACRECHVKADGSGLTVYKLTYPVTTTDTMTFPNDDLSLPANNAKMVISTVMDGTNNTTNHQINGSAAINIYNYGTCLSCHNGSTASPVNIWHGRPRFSAIPADHDDDAYHNHFDVLRYAPGRSHFNLWRGDGDSGEPYFSHPDEYYDNDGKAEDRGEDFYDEQLGRFGIQWNWGQANGFSMQEIPCFSSNGTGNDQDGLCGNNSGAATDLVPIFDDGPTRDSIRVLTASYDGSALTVEAENTNGSLRLRYNGTDEGALINDYGHHWQLTIQLGGNLPVNTVDLLTDNPLGTDVINYPICDSDPVSLTGAQWTPTDYGTGTLTVQAANSQGQNGSLTVTYNDTNYPMSWNNSQWTLETTELPYYNQLDIIGQCGVLLNQPVADNSDLITAASAAWDGTTIIIQAHNTLAGHTLSAEIDNIHTTMQEGSPNTWTLSQTAPYTRRITIYSDGFTKLTIPVTNNAAIIYPPACDSANDTDAIILPLRKAEFKPADGSIEVEAINQIGTADGTALYMTYSETSDGQGRYPMPHKDDNKFSYSGIVNNWQPGATVTVWSTDSSDRVRGIACSQPLIRKDGGDIISNGQALWYPADRRLVVSAANSMQDQARLYFEYGKHYAVPMTWDGAKWQGILLDVDYEPDMRIFSDQDDSQGIKVKDMTADPITMINAIWSSSQGTQGSLFIRAVGTQADRNPIFMDYGPYKGISLQWDNQAALWGINLEPIPYESTVRLWTASPGEITVPVSDLSTTHQDMSASSDCAVCHGNGDIVISIHGAHCDLCHDSGKPAVQNAINSAGPVDCQTCHQPIDESITVSQIGFNNGDSPAIALKDHSLPPDNNLITAPEYVRDGDNFPAAYSAGSPIVIETVFQADSGIDSAEIGSDIFPAQRVDFINGVSAPVYYTLPASVSAAPGAYILTINWSICDKNGGGLPDCAVPSPIHESRHAIFITHQAPAGAPPFYQQLVGWACQWSANAADNDGIVQNIYDGVWSLGTSGYRYVFPFKGRTYDKVGDILRQRQGACGEWAIFLLRAIESQGIDVYETTIIPTTVNGQPYDSFKVSSEALGSQHGPWIFPDHAFVIYGGDINNFTDPGIGTALDPVYHLSGQGWGGYEDVLIDEMGDEETNSWQANPGFGPAADILNSRLTRVIDDWDYYYGMDEEGYNNASTYYAP